MPRTMPRKARLGGAADRLPVVPDIVPGLRGAGTVPAQEGAPMPNPEDFHCKDCEQHYYLHKGQPFGPQCDWCLKHAYEK